MPKTFILHNNDSKKLLTNRLMNNHAKNLFFHFKGIY